MASKLTVISLLLMSTMTSAQTIQCLPVGWPCDYASECCVYSGSVSCCVWGVCATDDLCGYADDFITTGDEVTTPMEEDDVKFLSDETEENPSCSETDKPCVWTTDCCFHAGSGWCPFCNDKGICD